MYFPEQFLLFLCQVGRHLDRVRDDQVTKLPLLLVNRESLTFQPDFRIVLRARFYFQFHLAIQGIDNLLATQDRRIEVQGDGQVQIVSHPFETAVVRDNERDLQITGRASIHARPTLAFQLNGLPVGYAGGNRDTQVLAVHGDHLLMCLGRIHQG